MTQSADEFISSTPNIEEKKTKSNHHRILYKKLNQNQLQRKNHNCHTTAIGKSIPVVGSA